MAQDQSSGTTAEAAARVVSDLRSEFEATVAERAERYLRAQHHGVVAGTPFAGASSESIRLFRDGHFYGCISLSQAVGEAVVRHMCRSNRWKPAENFEENVTTLKRRRFIDGRLERLLLDIWRYRDDYHHLKDNIEVDRKKLERLAFVKIRALAEIEAVVFAYSFAAGRLVLKHPQYWPKPAKDRVGVFLRNPAV